MPETLLKKRKSQEKAREERAAATKKKREVSNFFSPHTFALVMIAKSKTRAIRPTTVKTPATAPLLLKNLRLGM